MISGVNFLESELLVLDGGLSTALRKYVKFDFESDPLWTARALVDDPEAIVNAHLDYLEAGADIISTCSYQASIPGFSKYLKLDAEEGKALIRKSVLLAKQAVDTFMNSGTKSTKNCRRPLIAGSIGPYGAYLCDRSEYTGKYMDNVTEEELITFHLPRLNELTKSGVDLLLLETMPSVKEVALILKALRHLSSASTIVSFSVAEPEPNKTCGKLLTAYGDSITSILELVKEHTDVVGFGINCCSPLLAQQFLKESTCAGESIQGFDIRKYKRIIYPNRRSWSSLSADHRLFELGLEGLPIDQYALEWLAAGAGILGGCCQVGPEEIKRLCKVIDTYRQ